MRRTLLSMAVTVGLAVTASPAAALTTCGSLGQPVCVETPAPGVELTLSATENPRGLKPLATMPSPTQPLWPRVRGHEPYGFNAVSNGTDGTSLAEEALLHQQMGASMARVVADWGSIQYYPNQSAGGPAWSYSYHLDPEYRAYIKRGVRPLLSIVRAPRRFTSRADTPRNSRVVGCETSDACHNPPTAEHLDKLAAFAADLAKRYPLAAGIEIWNEPNLSNPFWGGEPVDPEHYARMLGVAHDAIKSVRPAMPVIGGALAPFDQTGTDASGYERMSARTFLARMLRAGATADMDAVSYHPYFGPYPNHHPTRAEQDSSLYARMLSLDDAVLGGYADAGLPLDDRVVATEFGASTTDGWTEERQAAWLRLRYWLWDTDHAYLRLPVDAAFIHQTVEESAPAYDQHHKAGYGAVRVKDSRRRFGTKPVFCAFRVEFGGFTSCPSFVKL